MTEESINNDAFLSVPAATPSEILKGFADQVMTLKAQKEEHEAAAAALSSEINHITQKLMVDAMIECGTAEIKNADGVKFAIDFFVSGGLPKDDEPRKLAIDWLTENASGIIKSAVVLPFARDQYELAEAVREEMATRGYAVELETSVHTSSLQALGREALKNGTDLPFELLGLGHGQYVKVTVPKPKVAKS